MKKIIQSLVIAFSLFSILLVPTFALAQEREAGCEFDQNSQELCKLTESDNLEELVLNLTRYVMGIIGVIAIVMIVIAGFRMVISGGNEGSVKAAKNQLTWAVIGLIVALLAYTIVAIIQNVVKGI
jgi:hypothetical protein